MLTNHTLILVNKSPFWLRKTTSELWSPSGWYKHKSSYKMIRMVASFSLYHPRCTCSLATLTWNLPVSALAWASVQGQSVSTLMTNGSFSSSLSHARHLSRAHADEFCLNVSSSCQASAWSSVQTACTWLDENTPLDLQRCQRKSFSSAGDQSDTGRLRSNKRVYVREKCRIPLMHSRILSVTFEVPNCSKNQWTSLQPSVFYAWQK